MCKPMPKSELGVFSLQHLVEHFFLELFDQEEEGVVKFLLEPRSKSGERILIRPHIMRGVNRVIYGGREWPVKSVVRADTSDDPDHEGSAVVWLSVGGSTAGRCFSTAAMILKAGEKQYCLRMR
jgi:hypothetical protein